MKTFGNGTAVQTVVSHSQTLQKRKERVWLYETIWAVEVALPVWDFPYWPWKPSDM